MLCIKSDVITLECIEMYGFVTVWASMDNGPYWVILFMYGSHDMRHTGFRGLTMVNGTPEFWGVTKNKLDKSFFFSYKEIKLIFCFGKFRFSYKFDLGLVLLSMTRIAIKTI